MTREGMMGGMGVAKCARCRRPASIDRKHCGECLATRSAQRREQRRTRVAGGECERCRSPAEAGRSMCATHLLLLRQRTVRTPTQQSWDSMWTRCTNPKHASWQYYGARGISVCERWRSFEAFLSDMGARPQGTSLDRVNGNGNYEPGNCRWASPAEQSQNSSQAQWLELNGERHVFSDWARKLGITKRGLRYRLDHWTLERALSQPAPHPSRSPSSPPTD
jgi:hypothetical protein